MPWPTQTNFQGGVRAVIEGRIHGQTTNNVLWFVLPGELGDVDWPAKLAALGAAIIACVVEQLLPGLSSDYVLTGVRCTLMTDPARPEWLTTPTGGNAGGLAEALPSTCAAVISVRTPYAGKSNRGRHYLAGIPEANHAQSLMSGPPLAAVVAFLACMLGKFKFNDGTEEFRWVVFSSKKGYTAPSTYAFTNETTSPVTNVLARTVVGTVRRRRIGSGA